jgi:hypothetical protein
MSERDAQPPTHQDPHPQEPNVGHAATGPAHAHAEAHAGGHGHDPVRQQEDKPDVKAIFIVGVIGIVITIVSSYISWGFQLTQEHMISAAPTPAVIPGTYEVQANAGIIERMELPDRSFEVAHGEAQELKRDQDAQLSTYGWVDRPRGLIRVPIRQAMDQVVKAYGQHK